MKALVLNALGRAFEYEDVEIAAPQGREVLVDVQASGLCHTDLLFATHDIAPTPPARRRAEEMPFAQASFLPRSAARNASWA
jgi:D-arabinose 1-dehydrogenase-like Zn-dependent alcohol dehydrogenase